MGIAKVTTKQVAKDYFFICAGIMSYAFGYTAFILPEQVVMGGVSGISALLFYAFGLPAGASILVLNLAMLVLASKALSRQFTIRTVIGVSIMSLFVGLLQPLFQQYPIITAGEDKFMHVLIGGALGGAGLGLVFSHNGSTGGTDIVAAMVSKYRQVSVGRMILYVDLIIISSSFIIYHDLNKVIYGYVVLVFLSYMADQVVNNTRQAVQFTIFSKRWDEIATAVNHELHRGCTIVDGTGWYTRQEVKMLIIFCRKSEALDIYRLIKELDPHAFMSQSNVNTVYGEGFDENKVKARRRIDKQRKLQEAKENEARG